jgi:flagellar P-ring protein FlgI
MNKSFQALILTMLLTAASADCLAAVRLKNLLRPEGPSPQAIVGYGLVVGLAGSGDSSRNTATTQSVANLLREFGLQISPEQLSARNVAAVLVSAELPANCRSGDRLDVSVSALGDARSLAGGTLLVTPLLGTDRKVYASAQGSLNVGGYQFEQRGTSGQKNFPTTGTVPAGAIVDVTRETALVAADAKYLDLLLTEQDYTTAARAALLISQTYPHTHALPMDAGRIRLQLMSNDRVSVSALLAGIENLSIEPDVVARVVVSERTGTIVSGGGAWIAPVSIAQGALRVSIVERNQVSQPGGLLIDPGAGVRTAIVPEADLRIRETGAQSVELSQGATIGELVAALHTIKASSRDVIAVLQGLKRAGALHAELIVQ